MVLSTISPGFNNTKERGREVELLQKFRLLVQGKKIPKMDLTNEPRRLIRNAMVGTYPFAIKEDEVWQGVPVMEPAPDEKLDSGKPIPKELIGHERL